MSAGIADQEIPPRVRFYYIKSNLFRVVHVDGAIGGITSRGLIHCSLYSERPAIPQITEHQVTAEGRIGVPVEQEGKEGIVREMDVDLIMTKRTATELRDWLSNRISDLDKLEQESAEKGGSRAS
jgi:hypothetical protein